MLRISISLYQKQLIKILEFTFFVAKMIKIVGNFHAFFTIATTKKVIYLFIFFFEFAMKVVGKNFGIPICFL